MSVQWCADLKSWRFGAQLESVNEGKAFRSPKMLL